MRAYNNRIARTYKGRGRWISPAFKLEKHGKGMIRMTAEKILEIARKQLGIKEDPPRSNDVKFNTAYYGRAVSGSGYAWCAVFVWWCFREAGAAQLYYGGKKTAYCPTLVAYHREQAVAGDYRPGDVIFFNFSGKENAQHVGICESWDGRYITTIDGNTGPASEANGGAVMRRRREKKYIVGAYRPAYKEEDIVTQAEFNRMLENYLEEQARRPASPWAKQFVDLAPKAGISDGDRPQSFATREEVMTMLLKGEK